MDINEQTEDDGSGFTLVEVLVAMGILVVVLVGLLRLFIYGTKLADMSKGLTSAMNQAQGKIEDIRNTSFSQIAINYIAGGTPGNTFSITNPTGMGVVYLDTTNSVLYSVEVNVSWRNQDGRIIGEDLDLDGAIDAGEDVNNNGHLDSLVTLNSYVARR